MSIYTILFHPDKRLRTVAEPIVDFDDDLRQTAENMFETMRQAKGIGLAATQVNIHRRLIVMEIPQTDGTTPDDRQDENLPREKLVLINPEILEKSAEKSEYEEGCLSIPNQFAKVVRPAAVKVRFYDLDGKEQERAATGLLATCIQHEIDHLNGILFIDHLSRLKRERIEQRLAKYLKNQEKSANE